MKTVAVLNFRTGDVDIFEVPQETEVDEVYLDELGYPVNDIQWMSDVKRINIEESREEEDDRDEMPWDYGKHF